jgi:hypothetical protein
MVLGTPVIAITLLMLVLERPAPWHFRSAPRRRPGALPAPFWFYCIRRFIMILPPMASSARSSPASRKTVFGYCSSRSRASRIAAFGFLVKRITRSWRASRLLGAHLRSPFAVAVPSAVKTLTGRATLYRGDLVDDADDAFGSRLFSWAARRLFLASLGLDIHLTDILRRAPPLHHGGRHDHGFCGPALLVAQDDRDNAGSCPLRSVLISRFPLDVPPPQSRVSANVLSFQFSATFSALSIR